MAQLAPPPHLDTMDMKQYPGHQRFSLKDANPVVVYRGQMYDGGNGAKLKHDIAWLRKNRYTVMKEMAPLILKKTETKTKTCPSCNYSRLPSNAKFCLGCGIEQNVLTVDISDDKLAQLLMMVDPENPFALANEIHRDPSTQVRRSQETDFFNAASIKDVIQKELSNLGIVSGVPNEKGVQANPQPTFNPFCNVEF